MAKKLYPVVATVIAALLVLSCAGGAAPTTTPGGPAATPAVTPGATPKPAATPTPGATPAPVTAPATGPVKEVLYGYGVPLTGARGATYGIPAKRTFEMAAEKIGEFVVAGQRYRFKVLFEDNLYTTAGGVASATKLIFENKVKFMGQFGTSPTMAARPLTEKSKILLFPVSTPPDTLGPQYPYTFRVYEGREENTPLAFEWMVKNYPFVKVFYNILPDDDTGIAVYEATARAAKGYGIKTPIQYYPVGATDFYPMLAKALLEKPDVIHATVGEAPLIWKQAREKGFRGLFFTATYKSEYMKVAGPQILEGLIFMNPDLYDESTPDGWRNWAIEFKKKYNEEADPVMRFPYLELFVLSDAMKKAGTTEDVDKIAKVLETEWLETPIGKMKFGGKDLYGIDHQLFTPVWVGQITNGKQEVKDVMSVEVMLESLRKAYSGK